MTKNVTISAKALGGLNTPDFCERCSWILAKHKAPWQIFPSVFGDIDRYTKAAVQGHIARFGGPPTFISDGVFDGVVGYVEPPNWRRFGFLDGETGVYLRCEADGIYKREDGTHVIVDYKTARYTKGQDELLPVYVAQLNAYARIAEAYFGEQFRVSGIALIYFEPPGPGAQVREGAVTYTGLEMSLRATVHEVALDEGLVPRLLDEVRRLRDLPAMPDPAPGCKDCASLDALVGLFRP